MEDRTREQAARVDEWLAAGEQAEVIRSLDGQHPADIARLLAELPEDHVVTVFGMLPDAVAGEVLNETRGLVREALLERVDESKLATLLNILPEDDAADFLGGLERETAQRVLGLMRAPEAARASHLLDYGKETAGRLMTTEVVALQEEWTAGEALDYLRARGGEQETLYYLYVVDAQRRLTGIVPLRGILLSRPEVSVATLMRPEVVSVPATADREELAERMARYDFNAIPVVDNRARLIGVVTVDDVLDVLAEEATEDIQRLGGSEPLAEPYFRAGIPRIAAKRIVWLLPLFGASMLTDAVISSFGGLMTRVASLAIFIPVVSGTGGNAGSQTVATIMRALGTGDLRLSDAWRAWVREAGVALILGVCLGAMGYVRALWVGASPTIALVLALTLPAVIILANTLSTLIPLVAERIRIDPAVVSTPMIATLVDAVGILLYLSIAAALVGL